MASFYILSYNLYVIYFCVNLYKIAGEMTIFCISICFLLSETIMLCLPSI